VLIKRPNKDPFIKPFIIIGSENSNAISVLNQITLEIVYQYRFKDYNGGFICAEILGQTFFDEGY